MNVLLSITTLVVVLSLSIFLPADALSYSFTIIDAPNAYAASARGINNSGQVVGNFSESGAAAQGFVFNPGLGFTTISYGDSTNANGINDSGSVVGQFGDAVSPVQGFFYSGAAITALNVPGADLTALYGINDAAQIVGGFWGSGVHGFVESNGSFTPIDVPHSIQTIAYGINDKGDIVGAYEDGTGAQHGFVMSNSLFSTINVPGATDTFALGINNRSEIVGYYTTGTGAEVHGFLYQNGLYTVLNVPYVNNWTLASGINDRGQIAGTWKDMEGNARGFLATPVPEPSTVLLLGFGLVALSAIRYRFNLQ